jgi:hypothetical protein
MLGGRVRHKKSRLPQSSLLHKNISPLSGLSQHMLTPACKPLTSCRVALVLIQADQLSGTTDPAGDPGVTPVADISAATDGHLKTLFGLKGDLS